MIQDEKLNARNLRRELRSRSESMSQLREAGVESMEEVKRCCLGGDGSPSIVKYDAARS